MRLIQTLIVLICALITEGVIKKVLLLSGWLRTLTSLDVLESLTSEFIETSVTLYRYLGAILSSFLPLPLPPFLDWASSLPSSLSCLSSSTLPFFPLTSYLLSAISWL